MRPCATAPEPDHLLAVLARTALLGRLSEAERARVAERLTFHFVPGGEAVVRPGDRADAVWIVIHGRLRTWWDIDGSGRIEPHEAVDELGEGGLIGDVGLLSGEAHEALVIAVRDTELARLSATDLWELVRHHPELAETLGRGAVQLLRAAFRAPVRPDLVNVAVVPIDPGAPLRTFASALADALGANRSLRYVHADLFDAEVGPGASADDVDAWDATDRRIVRWVTEQERRYRFIVYEADRTWSAWTRRCAGSAWRTASASSAS